MGSAQIVTFYRDTQSQCYICVIINYILIRTNSLSWSKIFMFVMWIVVHTYNTKSGYGIYAFAEIIRYQRLQKVYSCYWYFCQQICAICLCAAVRTAIQSSEIWSILYADLGDEWWSVQKRRNSERKLIIEVFSTYSRASRHISHKTDHPSQF